MKRIFTVLLGFAISMSIYTGAAAYEMQSLENQTTFGLYYKDDPFDLAVDPGLLHQIDRWRLYTNLSNYEEADGYYLIGTSGKWGPGSFAFFYDTTKNITDNSSGDNDWNGTEAHDGSSYTGNYDITQNESEIYTYQNKDETTHFYIAYSMGFDDYSFGVSFEPMNSKRSLNLARPTNSGLGNPNLGHETNNLSTLYQDNASAFWTVFNGTMNGNAPSQEKLNIQGITPSTFGPTNSNFSRSDSEIRYFNGPSDRDNYYKSYVSDSFTGDNQIEDNSYRLAFSSDIHSTDDFSIQVTAEFNNIDEKVSGDALYRHNYSQNVVGSGSLTSPPAGLADGYKLTESLVSSWSGEFFDPAAYSRKGNEFGVELVPAYEVNETLSLEMDWGYFAADGDADGDWWQRVTSNRELKPDAASDTQVWNSTEFFNNSWEGKFEEYNYYIVPRIYLTYGPVDFSLGLGYYQTEEKVRAITREDMSFTFSYDNGDDVADASDWNCTSNRTAYTAWQAKTVETRWAWPVATRFKLTDKFTIRAGAEYSRTRTEYKYDSTDLGPDDHKFKVEDGTGNIVTTPPPTPSPMVGAASNTQDGEPYDNTHQRETISRENISNIDITEYRLGFGYQVTEHLTFDLMLQSTQQQNLTTNSGTIQLPGSGKGISTDLIYASVVLAF